jgi:molecular chaperone DnaK (HSP70)
MPPLISDIKESLQINDLFLTELKNLMKFKLFNREEMLKKKKPNSKEYINFKDLEELFKVCINKLNEEIENHCLTKSSCNEMNSIPFIDDSEEALELKNKTENKTKFDPKNVNFMPQIDCSTNCASKEFQKSGLSKKNSDKHNKRINEYNKRRGVDLLTGDLDKSLEVSEDETNNESTSNPFEKIDKDYKLNENVDLIDFTEDDDLTNQIPVVECAGSEEDSDESKVFLQLDGSENQSQEKMSVEKRNCFVQGNTSILEAVQNPLVSEVQCKKSADIKNDKHISEDLENKVKKLLIYVSHNLEKGKKSDIEIDEIEKKVTKITNENIIQESKRINKGETDKISEIGDLTNQIPVVEWSERKKDSGESKVFLQLDGNENQSQEKTSVEKRNCFVQGNTFILEAVQNPLVSEVQCEKSADIKNDKHISENLENKVKKLLINVSHNLEKDKKSDSEIDGIEKKVTQITNENIIQESKRINKGETESKLNSSTYLKTNPIIGNNYQRSNSKEIKESGCSQLIDSANEMRLKKFFEDTVHNCLMKYRESMEIYIKNHEFDTNYDIEGTHLSAKRAAFEFYRENLNKIGPKYLTKFKGEYYKIFDKRMDEAMMDFKEKIEQNVELLGKYQNVVRKIMSLYNMDMMSLIEKDLCKAFDLSSLTKISDMSEKKAIKQFNEETFKFYKENIDKYFLNKLKEEINFMSDKFHSIYNNIIVYEFNKKLTFENTKYYSEIKIKEFHNKERTRIMSSMQAFENSDLNKFTDLLLNLSLKKLEDQNDFIKQKEKEFAMKAIDLSFKIYCDFFEEKLKTSFYESKDVDDIRDKLLDFTITVMIDSCHFNEYQSYLVDYCKQELRLKVENIYQLKTDEYKKRIERVMIFITNARKDAIQRYCNEMKAKLSLKTYLKSNEFLELHHKCSKKAIETFIESTQTLKQDFDPEFLNKTLLESKSLIRKSISREKDNFKLKNERNTPLISSLAIFLGKQYLIAATYRNGVEIILDKFEQKLRPNSISFGNDILFGTEAHNHYLNTYSVIKPFQSFDIKNLFGRERSGVTYEELSLYPFTFSADRMNVHVDYHDLKLELSVESLLALMILEMKSDVEKIIGSQVSKIILTVPTNYNMNQKSAIQNAAKIAGFEDIDLISEISAAAITHSTERMKNDNKFLDTVLFVIMKGYECDVAICNISKKDIEFKSFFHQTLNSTEEEKKNFFFKVFPNIRSKEQDEDYLTKHLFKLLIDDLIKEADLKTLHIDECYIIGESPLIPNIKNWINKYVNPIPSMLSESFDMIIKGCAIYGQMLTNKLNLIEIREVTTHPIHFTFKIRHHKKLEIKVLPQNSTLPEVKIFCFKSPKSCDLPLRMNVFQKNSKVSSHLIEKLPVSDYGLHEWSEHRTLFNIDYCGQIEMTSILCHKNGISPINLEPTVTKSVLNNEDIRVENYKINIIIGKINEKNKLIEKNQLAGSAKMNLRHFCEKIKNDVEKNSELRSLIKKQILLEIKKTNDFLDSSNLDLIAIEKQKKILIKVLNEYMK